jgi:hypothetical protein
VLASKARKGSHEKEGEPRHHGSQSRSSANAPIFSRRRHRRAEKHSEPLSLGGHLGLWGQDPGNLVWVSLARGSEGPTGS